MTSRQFALLMAGIVAVLIVPFMAYNLVDDDFGLFRSNSQKRIWIQEKTSKYLMSFRYIPRNFNGILIGPSYSDGSVDTRRLTGYHIYNLSMEGGNATELRAATVNAIEHGRLRILIICLGPYLTKNSGMKGDEISPKEYWGSLFSLLPLRLAEAKFSAREHAATDLWAGSEWGSADLPRKTYTWDEFVRLSKADPVDDEIQIDPIAYEHLHDIIRTAHQHGVKVFAYFFPYNDWSAETAVRSGDWSRYRARITKLFDPSRDIVWDMMEPQYASLRHDAACYTDDHLSKAGISLVLTDIQRVLDQTLKGISVPPVFPRTSNLACLDTPGAGSGYDRNTIVSAAATRIL